MKELVTLDYFFAGAITPTTAGTAGPDIWKKRITGAAPPTVTGAASGIQCALTSANQAQVAGLSLGDILAHDIDDLVRVDFYLGLSASFAETVVAGLASTGNDTPESIQEFAFFKATGNNNLVISTDDNATDTNDVATGFTWPTTPKRFTIDFGGGLPVQNASTGLYQAGKNNIVFLAENSAGQLRRVAPSQRFTLGNYSGGLQPYVQISKGSGTNTGTVTCSRITIVKRFG
jgi:hypothetical protein